MNQHSPRTVSVFILGEFPVARIGLRHLLEASPEFVVVGDTADPEAVRHALPSLVPDVVLIDLPWTGVDGFRVLDQLGPLGRPPQWVALTSVVPEGLELRCSDCLRKQSPPQEILQRLRLIGSAHVGSLPAPGTNGYAGSTNGAAHAPHRPLLREVERELIRMVAEGLRSKEIAATLRLGCKSIETRRARLMRKLGCRNTVDLVRFAIRQGIVPA